MKRKMLSMKSSTSAPLGVARSLRHRQAEAERTCAGGCSSGRRRVRSITPDSDDLAPDRCPRGCAPDAGHRPTCRAGSSRCCLISSWISTVLPTPCRRTGQVVAHVRREQVDDLDAGLEDRRLRLEVLEQRRRAVDRPALGGVGDGVALVDRLDQRVKMRPSVTSPTGGRWARRSRSRRCRGPGPRWRPSRSAPDAVVAQVLLHLCDQDPVTTGMGIWSAL